MLNLRRGRKRLRPLLIFIEMRKLLLILVAAVLVVPAFAQKMTKEEKMRLYREIEER